MSLNSLITSLSWHLAIIVDLYIAQANTDDDDVSNWMHILPKITTKILNSHNVNRSYVDI